MSDTQQTEENYTVTPDQCYQVLLAIKEQTLKTAIEVEKLRIAIIGNSNG